MLRDKMKGTVNPLVCDSTLEVRGGRRAEEKIEPRCRQKSSRHCRTVKKCKCSSQRFVEPKGMHEMPVT